VWWWVEVLRWWVVVFDLFAAGGVGVGGTAGLFWLRWWFWLGGEVMLLWRCGGIWIAPSVCDWYCVWVVFIDIWFSDRFLNLLRFCMIFFRVFVGVQICWDLQVSNVSGWTLPYQCWLPGGCLQAETYMPRFSLCCCLINFWLRNLPFGFWWADDFWFEIGS
jgi:hypothetical protein